MENSTSGIGGPLSARDIGIRSYVIRIGRMSDTQKEALHALYPRYGVRWEPGRMLDSIKLFGRDAPFVVEVGFGMGAATVAIAKALPDTGFLGLEVHAPGVGKLLSEIEAQRIENLLVCRHDATEVVDAMMAPATVDGFNVFFPDPWPKKRHHKRRIMNPDFVKLMASRLKTGGWLYFVTDWEEYADATLEVLSAETSLSNACQPWARREPWRPVTKFEQRAIDEGRVVRELKFMKV